MTDIRPVLLVEDSADDEALMLRSMKKVNVANDVIVARDGVEALDQLHGRGEYAERGPLRPAVVLLDLKLPKVDGLEVLQAIRETPSTRRLPVVVLTSSDEQEDMVRSYDLAANSYVRKPIEFGEFTEVAGQLGLYWLMVNRPPPEVD